MFNINVVCDKISCAFFKINNRRCWINVTNSHKVLSTTDIRNLLMINWKILFDEKQAEGFTWTKQKGTILGATIGKVSPATNLCFNNNMVNIQLIMKCFVPFWLYGLFNVSIRLCFLKIFLPQSSLRRHRLSKCAYGAETRYCLML